MGSSSSTPKNLAEILSKTEFSQDEIVSFYKWFKAKHPMKSVSKSDFIEMFKDRYPNGDAEGFAEHVFRVYDADGNGVIDFQEFVCGLSALSRGNMEEKRQFAFRLLDEDDSGFISRKELMFLFAAYYRLEQDPKRLALDRAVVKTDGVFSALGAKRKENVLLLSYEDFKEIDMSGLLESIHSEQLGF